MNKLDLLNKLCMQVLKYIMHTALLKILRISLGHPVDVILRYS